MKTLVTGTLLALALAATACGSKTDDKPAAASAATSAKPEDKGAPERAAFIKAMKSGADKMCACKTVECVGKANEEIQAIKNPTSDPTEDDKKALDATAKQIEDCTKKLVENAKAEGEAAAASAAASASAAPEAHPAEAHH